MAESVLLSAKDLAALRDLCAPDFFSELGSAPIDMNRVRSCSRTVEAVRRLRVTIRFPSELGARRWNAWHERQIRFAGHFGTATIAVLVGAIATPTAGVAAGTIAGIAKDEIQARVWYPQVSRGWTLVREYELHYQQFPRARFYVLSTDTLIDHEGEQVERRFQGRTEAPVGGETGIPEGLLPRLFNASPAERTVIYE